MIHHRSLQPDTGALPVAPLAGFAALITAGAGLVGIPVMGIPLAGLLIAGAAVALVVTVVRRERRINSSFASAYEAHSAVRRWLDQQSQPQLLSSDADDGFGSDRFQDGAW